MAKNSFLKKAIAIIFSLVFLSTLFVFFKPTVGKRAYAAESKVYFSADSFNANDAGLIYAEVIAEGVRGQVISVTYHTESGTAIAGVDFNGTVNTVDIAVGADGKGKYIISIASKGNASERQKLLISAGGEYYGRYYNIVIDKAEQAEITRDRCKCYLPYNSSVEATVGVMQSEGEAAYINDYQIMQSLYHGGKGNLDGRSTWKSWKNGITFNNSTTTRWLNTYINTGLASAYSSYFVHTVDNSTWHSSTDIYILAGNDKFREKYDGVEHGIPGCYLYLGFEPHAIDDADRIDGRVMYLISKGKNPYKEDSDYIDVKSSDVSPYNKQVYWIQDRDAWFGNKNAFVDSVFYKTDPYNGKLDMAWIIWNKNKEVDIEFSRVWFLMTLIDETSPTVVGQYIDDSKMESDGKMRMYVRFNEPVVAAGKKSIEVKLNNSATPYYADYVEGNYTDTLVYEITPPPINITSVTYQLPTNDIGDMAYNLDKYKVIRNNKLQNTDQTRTFTILGGNINNVKPNLTIDKESNPTYKNNYNLMVSINDNGNLDLKEGTLYYEWSKDSNKENKNDASAYSYSRRLYEEDLGSTSISLVKNESEGIDSGQYYLHAMAVGKYGLIDTETYGPYLLDGDPPILRQEPLILNELKTKTYVLTNGKVGGAEVINVNFNATYKDGDSLVTQTLQLMKDGVAIKSLSMPETGVYYYNSNINDIDEDNDGLPDSLIDEFVLGLMGTKPRINLSVSFDVEDSAGNTAQSNAINVVYDKRDTFKVTSDFPSADGYVQLTDIQTAAPAYDISSVVRGSNKGISVTVAEADRSQIVDGTSFRVLVGDKIYQSSDDPYTVIIGDLTAGYYQLIPNIIGVVEESEVDLVANPVQFYLTDGKTDSTVNRIKSEGNIVFAGSVFRIDDARYYFLDREDKVSGHLYGATYNADQSKYEGGSSYPAFSNVNEAKKYVRYMEYLDLHLITLTANQASMLNSSAGTTTYVKAGGETRNAHEGQLWIRYKKKSWTSSANAYGWAYYFYSDGGTNNARIDLTRLSDNLTDAINSVVNHIVSAGRIVDLVTDSDLNTRSGAPYLSESQIHILPETTEYAKNGSAFVNSPVYEGDEGIYRNTVEIDGVSYPLATNMPITVVEGTSLYYRYYESTIWRPMDVIDGQLLSSVLKDNASGIYSIREYDENGVSEFTVYFDRTTPTLKMTINGEGYTLDGTVINYSGNSAYINFMREEIDPYGYVAVYSYPSRILRDVIRRDDIADYELGSGNYYLQVGDRSGNIVTYTVLLSTTQVEVKIEESESQSGIIVRVLNRDDAEIYSYEVYLNEELLTGEYSATKIFKDPGVYRVTLVDIYGNSITETYEYNFPSPKISWYYLNSMGGFSKYDPDNIVSMIISQDETNPRISNVYTSTRVRLTFDLNYGESPIRFEMLDIPQGSYSYAEATGVMTINTDESWRLRVWFDDYPQNDRTYVCRIDASAPEYEATFVGTMFTSNISFNDEFLSNYDEGDIISLDNLEIYEEDLSVLSFLDGSIISGSHISISMFDPSGIRNYSVTRNGQPISLSLNEDSQLIINNYGLYVITATDYLGNVSSFRFINIKDPVATATVDGEETGEDKAYGNKNLIVTTEYASTTTVLVKSEDVANTYVFEYDGNLLACSRYVCLIDNDSGTDKKYADVNRSDSIEINIKDNARVGRWYDVITEFNFTVSVKLDEQGKINYKVAAGEKVIDVQMLVSVGSNKRPCLFSATLSSKAPRIVLLTNDQPAEIVEGLKFIYVAGVLTIGDIDADITVIKAGYSLNAEIPELKTIYENGSFTEDFEGTEDGYYTITVANIFRNETIYRVQKIRSFSSLVTVTYLDGMKREYVSNPSVIASNYTIDLTVYSNSVHFEINDSVYEGFVVGGTTTLQLNRPGSYDVKIVASNGVFERFAFEIDSDPRFVLQEDWLTGYNEKALLKDQGYTNRLLSVVLGTGVEYVDVVFGDEREVIYDNVAETAVTDKSLNNVIGTMGNGTYTVNFRNIYGDVVSKTIYMSNVPLLKLSRKTIARPNEWESYSWSQALDGFYSNYVLRFETESINYVFRINGNDVSLGEPKTIELEKSSGNGSFEYEVFFVDEYGNMIEFRAILVRADVTIDTSAMQEIEIDGKIYTKDNVSVEFDDSYYATVSIDGDSPVNYTSGTVLYRDGEFAFTVSDIAGNVNEYVIVHKSVNKYTLTDAASGQSVIMGGVINNSSVVFDALDDSVVSTVVRNGKEVDSANTKTFNTSGHWELLIVDSLGNASYAEFFIVNNSLGRFDYSAPYNFMISEVWKTDSKGNISQIDTDGKSISLEENGDYVVGVTGVGILSSFRFTVTVDNTPPSITLVGVEDKGITANNVSVKGLKNGDNVKVYKDGVLVEDIDVSLSSSVPEITTGGDYKIVVTNIQGVSSEYTFTRKKIANAATSVFIIVVLAMMSVGIAIGLLYHTKQKTDA